MRRHLPNATAAWLEKFNPLAGMSIRDLQNVFDAARGGDTQRLHWIFQEIEAVNPTLSVCVDRRASAMANFQWRIAEKATADSSLAAEQKDAAERFFGDIENLSELFEHLDLAFFRGFAHAQPIWETEGSVRHISLVDSWRFVRRDGAWLYNPKCTGFTSDCVDCADARLVTVVRRRPIDYPALGVHVRDAVGNRDWGRFLERHALPKPAVTMHPGATEKDRADYLAAAVAVENGQVSVWPNGASLTDFAGGSRGTDPFKNFIEHQEETIVRLATGGTLGSIAQAGSGTLAGGAQQDVWESIVARDSSVIASAIDRALLRRFLDFAFPGKPVAVGFGFDFTKPPTPKEVFDTAAAARTAGWIIDQEELEEQTGYTLTPAPEAAQNTPQDPLFNPETPPLTLRNAATAFKTPISAFKTARKDLDAQGAVSAGNGSEGVLEAFCKDGSKAAQEVLKLLEDPTAEKAAELIEKLPSLLPEDPALAAVIAEAMAEEFRVPSDGVEELKVNNAISHPCPKCKRQLRRDGGCTYCERQTLLAGKLRRISPNEAKSLLSEPVSVKNPTGFEVKFTGEKLLADDAHLKAHHNNADYERRARVMLYAVDAAKTSRDVRTSRATKPNKDGVYAQRKEIRKQYTDPKSGRKFEVVVLADNNGDVYEVFDVYPR